MGKLPNPTGIPGLEIPQSRIPGLEKRSRIAISSPVTHHWCKFGENPTNTFQVIVLTSPESAVSSILYSTMTLTFDPKLCFHIHASG